MRKLIMFVALLFVVGTAAMQFSTAYKAQSDLADQVEKQLDAVNDASLKVVAQNVVAAAQKLGIVLTTNDVRVTYSDSDRQTVAQKYVSKPLHTQFENKEAAIKIHYTARVLGFPLKQEIERSRLQQKKMAPPAHNAELNQVLDGIQ